MGASKPQREGRVRLLVTTRSCQNCLMLYCFFKYLVFRKSWFCKFLKDLPPRFEEVIELHNNFRNTFFRLQKMLKIVSIPGNMELPHLCVYLI